MKKFLVAFIAVAFVIGLVANTAVADDRLSLSGEMRVRAWSKDNYDFDTESEDAFNEKFWDQRFRMMAVISPADGVKGVLRFDFAEDHWGSDNWAGVRYNETSELQVDRAYLDVTRGILNIKAGQQYIGLGNSIAYDAQATGLVFTINTPVVVTAGFVKASENGSKSDEEIGGNDREDTDQYVLDVSYKTDAFKIGAFYAMQTDGRDGDDNPEPTVMGLYGKFAIGPVNFWGEFNSFGGSYNSTVDYTGMQLYLEPSIALNDQLTLGANVVYSDGTAEDDELKITRMPNAYFGSWNASDYGAFNTDITPLACPITGVPDGVAGDVFDPAGTQAGAMGLGIFAKFVPVEDWTLYGQVMYLQAVEDDRNGEFSDATIFNVSAEYQLVKNCAVAVGYNYTNLEADDDVETDTAQCMVARLNITF